MGEAAAKLRERQGPGLCSHAPAISEKADGAGRGPDRGRCRAGAESRADRDYVTLPAEAFRGRQREEHHAALTLVVANLFDLSSISTPGSAGFLLIFVVVNVGNARRAAETKSHA